MRHQVETDRLTQLEKLVADLGDRLSDLEGSKWQRVTIAAGILSTNPRTMVYRLTNYPELYPEGIAWRWNPTQSLRLINISEWRKAEESYFTSQKNRRECALAIAREARKSNKQRERDTAAKWRRLSVAAEELFCHPATLAYQIKSHPETYREGIAWKWNRNGSLKLVNVAEWLKAEAEKSVDKSTLKQKGGK